MWWNLVDESRSELASQATKTSPHYRSQWPHGLRRGSAATLVLGIAGSDTVGTWMSVFCERCVLSGRGLCDGLITCPEETYRV